MRVEDIYDKVRDIAESRGISMIEDILHLFIEFLDENKIGLDETKLVLQYHDISAVGCISDVDYSDVHGFYFTWTHSGSSLPEGRIPLKSNIAVFHRIS